MGCRRAQPRDASRLTATVSLPLKPPSEAALSCLPLTPLRAPPRHVTSARAQQEQAARPRKETRLKIANAFGIALLDL